MRPSWHGGFARHAGESVAPWAWRGLLAGWVPVLGPVGKVYDLMGQHHGAFAKGSGIGVGDCEWHTGGPNPGVETASGAYNEDGAYVDCGSGWTPSSPYTITAAVDVYTTAWYVPNNGMYPFSIGDNSAVANLAFGMTGDGGSDLDRLVVHYDGVSLVNSSTYRIPIPGRYVLCMTVIPSGALVVYVDGTLLWSTTVGAWPADPGTVALSGHHRTGSIVYGTLNGTNEMVLLHNRVLSLAEIQSLAADPFALLRVRRRTYKAPSAASGNAFYYQRNQ